MSRPRALANFPHGLSLIGGTLVVSVAANALTLAVKTLQGADPSAANPVTVMFRDATAATGDYAVLSITAATSLTISSGSTLGVASGIAFRLWIVGFDDGGTFRLGAINCLSGADIYPLGQNLIASSTAEGGAGGADSAQVFYTGAAVSAKAYAILGTTTWESGLTTAGTWDAVPTRIRLFDAAHPLPGAIVQRVRTATGAVATGTTVLPDDDTIPQNTEGNQYLSKAITPSSAANLLAVRAKAYISNSAGNKLTAALFRDSAAGAVAVASEQTAADCITIFPLDYAVLAGSAAATTFNVRAGSGTAGTTTFNGTLAARKFGGALDSFLEIGEIMA